MKHVIGVFPKNQLTRKASVQPEHWVAYNAGLISEISIEHDGVEVRSITGDEIHVFMYDALLNAQYSAEKDAFYWLGSY